jgi:hypothetical protein
VQSYKSCNAGTGLYLPQDVDNNGVIDQTDLMSQSDGICIAANTAIETYYNSEISKCVGAARMDAIRRGCGSWMGFAAVRIGLLTRVSNVFFCSQYIRGTNAMECAEAVLNGSAIGTLYDSPLIEYYAQLHPTLEVCECVRGCAAIAARQCRLHDAYCVFSY